ncbi:MAG: TetR/AcrR family transcriptional regulator [Chloroflexi bacterium]|jgi:TetR/AcrR family transcriptional regulator|nr:TetR/AcrR family transcriptional regulator [Anaerolineaceae bacterium]NLI44753.1 TetR/AcrR family transcriptional regulator [Chloroflexota bacterium]HOE35209.1 TetR/AcrR family transcriptional regulator [Anaerolineaceae bacterium]HOT25541.1 TetR/AcrR family transcriptional regulator [Anaerolineaceae bacterium]HQK03433.1 TetR/AcrR family transcriptional regulator [Anaerolineaceae bacterium]
MNNRTTILETALAFFAAFGYEATGTLEICDAAGVTKPTMYHYFKSKRGLMEAILSENFEPFLQRLKEASTYQHDITLNLEKIMRAYFKFAQENPVFYRLQFSMQSAPLKSESYELVSPWVKRQREMIQAMFRQAEEDHGNMRGRSWGYTTTLLGMINAYVSDALAHERELDDELIYQARHQFMHGIFS